MCNNWPDFPIDVKLGTGGLIGDTVIICGGFDDCYSLTSEKATLFTHISVGRDGAASIVINDNTLWVTGGYYENNYGGVYLASTEYVTMTKSMHGPDLPMNLAGHAMVAFNNTYSMVIGGFFYGYFYASTIFYDRNVEEWISGPSLILARYWHAAGIVTDEVTDENFVAVTGGKGSGYLDSTEILQDGNWVQGNINDATK